MPASRTTDTGCPPPVAATAAHGVGGADHARIRVPETSLIMCPWSRRLGATRLRLRKISRRPGR